MLKTKGRIGKKMDKGVELRQKSIKDIKTLTQFIGL